MAYNTTGTKVKLNNMEVLTTQVDLELINGKATVDVLITEDLGIVKLEEMLAERVFVEVTAYSNEVLDYVVQEATITLAPQDVIVARLECERAIIVK